MTPALLRQSGPKFFKDGKTHTPRALIQICEECGTEGSPYGHMDDQGKRLYFCREHNPDFQHAKGQDAA